jgi:hypothetical protein
VIAVAGSALALILGPYSKALITANAAPGLSNLAPPTIVLCLFGVAQILVILLAWNALARWLSRDRVWVPVAIAGSRSMGIYIWHMLVTSIVIATLVLAGIAPAPLSVTWWLLHGGSLVVVLVVSWFIAAPAQWMSRAMVMGLAGMPWRFSSPVVGVAALVAAASVLGISESGLYPFVEFRWVAGVLPYFPLIAVALVMCGLVVSAGRGRPTPERGTGP